MDSALVWVFLLPLTLRCTPSLSDPVSPDPVLPDSVSPDPVLPDPVSPDPVSPDPVSPDRVSPDPVSPDPVSPDPVSSDPVSPDPVSPDPVSPDPVPPDPVSPDPVSPDPVSPDPVAVVDCVDGDPELRQRVLTEGESLWFEVDWDDQQNHFTWYWNTSQDVLPVSTEETDLVHANGPALFLLNATRRRSGCYMTREEDEDGLVMDHFLRVSVVPQNSSLGHYGGVLGDTSIIIYCPSPVQDTCVQLNGTMSWSKDAVLLPGEHSPVLVISDAQTEDEGVYDCVCTWTHQQHLYRSVGSRPVRLKEPSAPLDPVQILTPSEEELLVDAGARLLLNCSVLCGTNVPLHRCKAWWRTQTPAPHSEGYNRTQVNILDASQNTISTEVLTIARVSAEDLQQSFECMGRGPFRDAVSFTVRLRARQSMASLAAVGTCAVLVSVLMAVMVKCFSVDLALLFRRFIPFRLKDRGVKVFDAYVVFQLQHSDKPTEEALARFISQDLPLVLEEQCGYRLFIHGRDDLPGEDLVELVEERMKKSRRLIVILTPGSRSEVTEAYAEPEGYYCQVGLHQALVQGELSVILIQLGDTGPGGYSHLPPALQHLVQRSSPIRWPLEPQAARANSRLWKRVRYLMPAAATPCPHLRPCPPSEALSTI